MRYSEIELQYLDIMWFAVDTNGCIAVFTSAGESFIPEFVCQSKEETDYLENYFLNELNVSTNPILYVEDVDNSLMNDFKLLASKGLYCYDSCDLLDADYSICINPKTPIHVMNLPEEIRKKMSEHTLNIDFSQERFINVEKAEGKFKWFVSNNRKDHTCTSWLEIKNLIMQSQKDKYDDIWISGEDEYPCLSILVNKNDTCIHYYLNDNGDMWQSVGNYDKDISFVSNNDMSTFVEMPSNTIIPLYKAIQCAKEFCKDFERPNCIEWRKL